MGRFRGGAARSRWFASSLFGSISGIAAASALAVGVVDHPAHEEVGHPGAPRAAIEALRANGAQLIAP